LEGFGRKSKAKNRGRSVRITNLPEFKEGQKKLPRPSGGGIEGPERPVRTGDFLRSA